MRTLNDKIHLILLAKVNFINAIFLWIIYKNGDYSSTASGPPSLQGKANDKLLFKPFLGKREGGSAELPSLYIFYQEVTFVKVQAP